MQVIPFAEFMSKTTTLAIVPPDLPLLEGLLGFGTLGLVLVTLTTLEKVGILSANNGLVEGCLTVGFILGLLGLLFKASKLLGL